MNIAPIASTTQQPGPLLSRKDAAHYLGLAPQTLAQWVVSRRHQLPYVSIGRKAMYRKADLDAFITANTHGANAIAVKGSLQ
ncbi:helix-turn-helix domain-containing protein [Massilia glaciei]|uniref:DNA-binding protein n=1 Tax=Massilia glaciei TaxID=1524097 RepID=A0A2U2HGG7_9BURK|nr:helix-turn-helix domain-containing protein [Massilia glaciei]PWF44021.1 DNA-binding protein [Massilia glaciei]